MNAPLPADDDSDRTRPSEAGHQGDEPAEELETGRPRRLAVTAPWVLAAIVAAGAAGFFIGDHHGRSPARVVITTTPANTTTAAAPFTNLTTDNKCSAQIGRQLQLGVEIQNQGNTDVELRSVTPVFPLHGLQAVRTQHGICGQPAAAGEIAGWLIKPGSSVWITTTVKVLRLACPAPLPVQFDVTYNSAGRQNRQQLTGFGDLGSVPYTGCRH